MQEKAQETKKAPVDRRSFMQQAAAVLTTAGAVSATAKADVYKSIMPSMVLGANERIRMGVIGTGVMGSAHVSFLVRRKLQFQKTDHEIIAICDLYPKNLEKATKFAGYAQDWKFTTHHDFREVIENKDVDAVLIATPDHWHCLCTLYAADAKKDIYCEKPLSTTIEEGLAMTEAVKRNKVVFQAGTMQRSATHFKEAVDMIRAGYIGPVYRVETFNHENKKLDYMGMGETDISKFPGCDWDFHQGWVERVPFNKNRWLYDFRWFLDYSGGKITDWGVHLIDIALWAMGEDQSPKSVTAIGNKFAMQDNRTTPDTLEAIWEYEKYILTFSNRVYNGYLHKDYSDHGIIFHGTLGTMRVDRGGYEVYQAPNGNGPCEPKQYKLQEDQDTFYFKHWDNFFACVRDRSEPTCAIDKILNTTRTCHMGTCSYVAGGAKLGWDAAKNQFIGGDAEAVKKANAWAYRPYQNGWSLKAPYKA